MDGAEERLERLLVAVEDPPGKRQVEIQNVALMPTEIIRSNVL
jgi:hypothetical protein